MIVTAIMRRMYYKVAINYPVACPVISHMPSVDYTRLTSLPISDRDKSIASTAAVVQYTTVVYSKIYY